MPPPRPSEAPPPPPPEQARINLADLKSQIAKRLGPDRTQRYFGYLNRLLSQKLSKPEFNKLCLLTLGKDNLPLHNQLIRSVLKNAFHAKTPPPVQAPAKPAGSSQHNPSPALAPAPAPAQPPPVWSNGSSLPPSPRKGRSGGGFRRSKDRPTPLGPNGRLDAAAHQALPPSGDDVVARENGSSAHHDLKRLVPNQPIATEDQPAKRQRTEEKLSPGCNKVSVRCVDIAEVVSSEVRRDAEHRIVVTSARGPVQAPLGIPLCPVSAGGVQRSVPLPAVISNISSNYYTGELCHTDTLRKRMEAIAEARGLKGVSVDCTNLLNNGLDAYLKGLIRSCFDLARARSRHEPVKQLVQNQQPQRRPINGVWLENHTHAQRSSRPAEGVSHLQNQCTISMQDFKVAMELKPQQLGEDWPLLLEKICLSSFEE